MSAITPTISCANSASGPRRIWWPRADSFGNSRCASDSLMMQTSGAPSRSRALQPEKTGEEQARADEQHDGEHNLADNQDGAEGATAPARRTPGGVLQGLGHVGLRRLPGGREADQQRRQKRHADGGDERAA